jgi:CBS-domain-containing membrane protein
MHVKDIMHTAVTTVTPKTRVSTAYQRMTTRDARIRHLPVVTDEKTLVGMLTDVWRDRLPAGDDPDQGMHDHRRGIDRSC